MAENSTNLGLKYYDTGVDSQAKFLTFRSDLMSPVSSNMKKIDDWAGSVNTKITNVEKRASGVLIQGLYQSTGYFEATNSNITSYFTGLTITISLNEESDGSTMLKINALDVKMLMKYDGQGNVINIAKGDLKKNHEHLFRYNGTSWVWQSGTSGDQINIDGGVSGNLISVDTDGSIMDSGVQSEDVIMRNNDIDDLVEDVGGIKDADTLGGRASTYFASKEDLNLKANKTQILTDVPANAKFTDTVTDVVNNLTETVANKALDARQGKVLDDKITQTNQNVAINTQGISNVNIQLNDIVDDLVAHKAENVSRLIVVTRDISISGTFTISTPFKAKSINLNARLSSNVSFGFCDEKMVQRNINYNNGYFSGSLSVAHISSSSLDYVQIHITAINKNSIELNIEKTGNPTGTVALYILLSTHGG